MEARASTNSLVISGVDHVMVRADDPRPLYEFFTEELGLPAGQPPTSYPGPFTNAIIPVGNTVLELIHFGPLPESALQSTPARLWGLAFEPARSLDESRKELDRRRIPRGTPQVFERPTPDGGLQKMWTILNVSLLENTRKARAAFFAQRLLGPLFSKIQRRQMRRLASRGGEAQWMDERRIDAMNDVVGHGWVFLTEYDPDFLDPAAYSAEAGGVWEERGVGPLGIKKLAEVVIGTTDAGAAREQWRRFFTPATEVEPGLWDIGRDPAVRVVPHTENRLRSLVFKIASQKKRGFSWRVRACSATHQETNFSSPQRLSAVWRCG